MGRRKRIQGIIGIMLVINHLLIYPSRKSRGEYRVDKGVPGGHLTCTDLGNIPE